MRWSGVGKCDPQPWVVDDGLWARIAPLLPVRQRRYRYPGRKAMDDRQVLCGILFVLYTGIRWEWLPAELGYGSGMTCWRRLRDWNEAGVWQSLHELLLAELRAADRLDLSRAVIDSSRSGHEGRPKTGRSPVDRGRPGSKHRVICDANGVPLAVRLTGGNFNDMRELAPMLEALPPIRGKVGRPASLPSEVYADGGYDSRANRALLRARKIRHRIARRNQHNSGLGTKRWVVEQTIALLHWFRRLRIRWEIRDDIHEAFLKLACSLICWRRLRPALR
ncbi:IS5 family transposase [Streptomyces virginiae]|uniref:IS5 family transposase n=1 Tax=Streptomyces virginiae TaxID=1961 RepID=UPI0036AF157C